MKNAAVCTLQMCDIALLLQTRGETFDWDRRLRRSRGEEEPILVTLGLAHQLLATRS